MKRRHFLYAICGVASLAAAVFGWRYRHMTEQDAIVSIIKRRLNYLRLDAAGLRRFAATVAAEQSISGAKLRSLAASGPLAALLPLPGASSLVEQISHGADRLVTDYLLSSDFFLMGADVSRVVLYIAQYDPVRACGNPFARRPTDA
ncbi:MAG: hypothetical protein ABJC66_03290 [Gammaproteobacteria bacterium]